MIYKTGCMDSPYSLFYFITIIRKPVIKALSGEAWGLRFTANLRLEAYDFMVQGMRARQRSTANLRPLTM